MRGVMSMIEPHVAVAQGARMLRWRGTPYPNQVLVFLHGLGDGADVWRPVVDAWPDGPITAIALDLPGHGGSEFWDATRYTVPELSAWVADVLAREGIRNPILIGHSLGGRIALEAASGNAIQPSHVVVVDVSPDARRDDELDSTIRDHLQMLAVGAPSLSSFRQKIGARLPMADRDALARIVPALVEAGEASDAAGVRLRLDPEIHRLLNAPSDVDGWRALDSLGCPGTIIRGAFSSALDAATAQRMARTLRCPSSTVSVPKAGHAIPFEQPVALAKAIAQGLRTKTL